MQLPTALIDLSWPLAPGMPVYPGDPPVALTRMGSLAADGFLSHRASLPGHTGTHVDAPAHVISGGATLAELPLARFAGPGVVLDLTTRPGLAVTAEDLAPHLDFVRQAAPAFVLLRTGDAARFGQADYYPQGAHLTSEAAMVLAELAGLSGIGLDAGSADPFGSRDLPAHKALLGAGLVIIENLRRLEALPPATKGSFLFLCLPVLGLDGSPVRAAALLSKGVLP